MAATPEGGLPSTIIYNEQSWQVNAPGDSLVPTDLALSVGGGDRRYSGDPGALITLQKPPLWNPELTKEDVRGF